jgi:shikimate dehydrogenase
MNIVLCGMMGSGKTTVANELAKLYNLEKVDTDQLITERYGVISQIFDKHGEKYFRDIETRISQEVASKYNNAVISLGGGCVLRAQNVEYLRSTGRLFFLRASLDTLVNRVEDDGTRPLLKGCVRDKMETLLEVRTPIYERVADYIIDTDNLTPCEIAEKIMSLIATATNN